MARIFKSAKGLAVVRVLLDVLHLRDMMRFVLLAAFLLAVGPAARAEPAVSDPALETRFIKACLADGDTEAYCRCDFAHLARRVARRDDLELVVSIRERTAAQSREAIAEAIGELSTEQKKVLIALSREMQALTATCPDHRSGQ